MKYFIRIRSEMKCVDTELPIGFCLIGKRNESFNKPSDELMLRAGRVGKFDDPLTSEEQDEVYRYNFKRGKGYYHLQSLGWTEKEEQAMALKSHFPEPEWDQSSFEIKAVRSVTYT